jgi:hypothetical protein
MANLFQAPVPGQSLTDTPRNAPWERPAEIDTVEDVVKYYINKLADQETLDDVAVTFKLGADLRTLTQTIMTTGSMKGLHTVETGMLAGPVVASFIKMAMEEYGIETPETPVSFEEAITAKEKARIQRLTEAAVDEALKSGADESDSGVSLLKEIAAADKSEDIESTATPMEDTEKEQAPMPAKGAGLMSRGGDL